MKNPLLALVYCCVTLSIISCSSNNGEAVVNPKNLGLLNINKPDATKTESERAVGCWASTAEQLKGTGNPRTIKGAMNHRLIFYSNGNLDDVIYFSIGGIDNDPLITHMFGYQINGGTLTYTIDGKAVSRKIDLNAEHIELDGRTYVKGQCL